MDPFNDNNSLTGSFMRAGKLRQGVDAENSGDHADAIKHSFDADLYFGFPAELGKLNNVYLYLAGLSFPGGIDDDLVVIGPEADALYNFLHCLAVKDVEGVILNRDRLVDALTRRPEAERDRAPLMGETHLQMRIDAWILARSLIKHDLDWLGDLDNCRQVSDKLAEDIKIDKYDH